MDIVQIMSMLENYDDIHPYIARDQNLYINYINDVMGENITYPPPDDN